MNGAMDAQTEKPKGNVRQRDAVALVVDDDEAAALLLKTFLDMHGFETHMANCVLAAQSTLGSLVPDLILLDVDMPGMSGIEFLSELRANPLTRFVPVIMVSGLADSDTVVSGLAAGANDYVTKPLDMAVLLARISTHMKVASRLNTLQRQTRWFSRLANFDELTGALNRRTLTDVLEREIRRSKRYNHPLSILMIDLDDFKAVNDRLGHLAGDSLLRQIARRMSECLRSSDLLCRYGGEEFCVVLPHTDAANAMQAAEHLRSSVSREPFDVGPGQVAMTVSIGVATFPCESPCGMKELIHSADQALYEAKRAGKNRCAATFPAKHAGTD